MSSSLLEQLGLKVERTPAGTEAELQLTGITLLNPLTRQPIPRVRFSVLGDRLLVTDPPELIGCAPVTLSSLERASDLEAALSGALDEQLLILQRRAGELQALGVSPKVDPETLRLTAEVSFAGLSFVIGGDRTGTFRLMQAIRDGSPLDVSSSQTFELSEFRELSALQGYLAALVGEPVEQPAAAAPAPAERLVSFGELARKFGPRALLPPRSALEVLVELSVRGERYRFAAARVSGRTFRGLLAGARGKLWAERFDIDQFPGVLVLVAQLLRVSPDDVQILSEGG